MENLISSSDGIKCPYCGHLHNESEDWSGQCTYWGSEDGANEYECQHCSLTFRVREIVSRSWDSMPVVQSKARGGE